MSSPPGRAATTSGLNQSRKCDGSQPSSVAPGRRGPGAFGIHCARECFRSSLRAAVERSNNTVDISTTRFAMISLMGWILFGLVAGAIARFLHPGFDSMGLMGTIMLGILG